MMTATPTSSEPSLTSFVQLFGLKISGLVINRIEIPLIQRDYAQGRQGEVVERIRANFLNALCEAVTPGGKAIGLDFVYGDVVNHGENKGVFYPLDGQQRLTTLFLLHWYLAWRAGLPIQYAPWTKFTYATRPSARLFCERLSEFQPLVHEVVGDKTLSSWLTDQAWYLHTWQLDPTIQSMQVMLDALHQRFSSWSNEGCKIAWQSLNDTKNPAISFHLLRMEANGLTNDLYIKMNSRGKPLTIFENFKANFETLLKKRHPAESTDYFAKQVDTEWADTLWHYRGDDSLIDDEFMRYFRFVTEVCAWQSGISFNGTSRTDALAEQLYGEDSAKAKAIDNLQFLFQSFDVWHQKNIKTEFERLFTATPNGTTTPLILFNALKNVRKDESPVDLFAACCRLYGEAEWTLAHTLLLYAVLLDSIHRQRQQAPNFPKQLRILRNLIEASVGGEIREQKMPELLADVKRVVVDGTLQGIMAFNQAQVANENEKAALLAQYPALELTLNRLEDHVLLRGCLLAFDLDPSTSLSDFKQRADAFHTLFSTPSCWPNLTGALLAIDNYSRTQRQRFSDFGAPKKTESWRNLLAGTRMPHFVSALMNLFDQVAAANNDLICLETIQQNFLLKCGNSTNMDWRYYFVKYMEMREGYSGRYVGIFGKRGGYNICMLNKIRMSSDYRDPYLLAILRQSGVVADTAVVDPWFSGYETEARRMVLKKSGIQIQCVDQGWQITEAPSDPAPKTAFDQICLTHHISLNGLFVVPQNNGVDTCDRVTLGAAILADLVNAGL